MIYTAIRKGQFLVIHMLINTLVYLNILCMKRKIIIIDNKIK